MPRCQSSVTVVWRVLLVMALSRRLVACVGSQVEEREGQARAFFKVDAKVGGARQTDEHCGAARPRQPVCCANPRRARHVACRTLLQSFSARSHCCVFM